MKRVGAAAAVSALGACGWAMLAVEWQPERERAIAEALGWVACAWLLATLTASLVKKLRRWRRAMGIGTACLALAHVVAAFVGPLSRAWSVAWTWPRYRAGALAFAILLVLLATSFPKRLRVREWKALHRLVYGAALLVAVHVAKLSTAMLAAGVTALVLVLLLARVRGGLGFIAGNFESEKARKE